MLFSADRKSTIALWTSVSHLFLAEEKQCSIFFLLLLYVLYDISLCLLMTLA